MSDTNPAGALRRIGPAYRGQTGHVGIIEAYLDNIRLKDGETPSGADDMEVLIALSLVSLPASTNRR